jgi:uncharacterized Tic20 family protein
MFLFAPFVLAPLVLWLVKKDESSFVDDHGREVLNLLLSALVFTVGLGLIPILGWAVLATWYLVTAVKLVRGAVASSNGEYFRYPMTIRFLS